MSAASVTQPPSYVWYCQVASLMPLWEAHMKIVGLGHLKGLVLPSINSLIPEVTGSNSELVKACMACHRATFKKFFYSDMAGWTQVCLEAWKIHVSAQDGGGT